MFLRSLGHQNLLLEAIDKVITSFGLLFKEVYRPPRLKACVSMIRVVIWKRIHAFLIHYHLCISILGESHTASEYQCKCYLCESFLWECLVLSLVSDPWGCQRQSRWGWRRLALVPPCWGQAPALPSTGWVNFRLPFLSLEVELWLRKPQ